MAGFEWVDERRFKTKPLLKGNLFCDPQYTLFEVLLYFQERFCTAFVTDFVGQNFYVGKRLWFCVYHMYRSKALNVTAVEIFPCLVLMFLRRFKFSISWIGSWDAFSFYFIYNLLSLFRYMNFRCNTSYYLFAIYFSVRKYILCLLCNKNEVVRQTASNRKTLDSTKASCIF